MECAPITFEHKGKTYSGYLSPVQGAGENVWHLMIAKRYYGSLQLTDKWIFHAYDADNSFSELADFFGEYLIAWYE